MVAAEGFTGLQSAAALAFAANELVLGLGFHRLLADETAMAIERGMTAAGAERLTVIADGCRQLATALRVAAHVPHLGFGEFGHAIGSSVVAWSRSGKA